MQPKVCADRFTIWSVKEAHITPRKEYCWIKYRSTCQRSYGVHLARMNWKVWKRVLSHRLSVHKPSDRTDQEMMWNKEGTDTTMQEDILRVEDAKAQHSVKRRFPLKQVTSCETSARFRHMRMDEPVMKVEDAGFKS